MEAVVMAAFYRDISVEKIPVCLVWGELLKKPLKQ